MIRDRKRVVKTTEGEEREEVDLLCMVGPCWPMIFVTTALILFIAPPVLIYLQTKREEFPVIKYMTPVVALLQIVTFVTYFLVVFSNPGLQQYVAVPPSEREANEEAASPTSSDPNVDHEGPVRKQRKRRNKLQQRQFFQRRKRLLEHKKGQERWYYDERLETHRQGNWRYDRESQTVIKDIDHFCPWTGTIIAKNNMTRFQAFVVIQWIFCWVTVLLPMGILIKENI